jgi:hypothetical protein
LQQESAVRPHLRLIFGLLVATLMASGCVRKKNKNPLQATGEQNPEETYIKAGPRTKVLSVEQLQALVSLNEAGEMIFQNSPLQGQQNLLAAPSFAEGDILVLAPHQAAPQGALRKIKSLMVQDAQVVLQTEPAALTEAIEEARVHMTIPLDPSQAQETLTPLEGIAAQNPTMLKLLDEKQGLYFGINDYVLVDIDGNKTTKNDQVILNGNLGVNAGADFIFRIEAFELKEIKSASATAMSRAPRARILKAIPSSILNLQKMITKAIRILMPPQMMPW